VRALIGRYFSQELVLRSPFASLRARLLWLVLMAILPAMGLVLYTGLEQRREAAAQAKDEALRLVRVASANQAQLIEGARQLLIALAELPEVRGGDPAACHALFNALLNQYSLYANLGVADPNGDVWCSAVPLTGRVNISDRVYFRRAQKTHGFAVGDYQIGRITGKATVNFGYPALDAWGDVSGVVFAALDLTWLNQLAAEAQLPAGAALTVIDRAGTILARYPDPEQWVGKVVSDALLLSVIAAGPDEGTTEATGVDGVGRLYAFAPLGGALDADGVYVSVGVPSQVAFAEVNRLLATNVIGLGGIGLLAFVAAWVGGELFILRRVKALVNAARRLSAGDLSARTHLPYGSGEISHLARAFDQMAETLERQEVERRQADEALRASEERYRSLVESARDVIFTLDVDGAITSLNPAFEITTGLARQDWLGKVFHPLLHPHDLSGGLDLLRQVVQGETPPAFEVRVVNRAGNYLVLEITLTPRIQSGEVVGALGIARDITERKQAEDEIHRHAARAEALARIAARLNAQLNLEAVLNAVCEEAAYALNVPAASVALYEPVQDEIRLALTLGLPPDYRQHHRPVPRALYDQYARRFGPLIVFPDVRAEANLPNAELYARYDIHTIACAGLMRDEQLIGTLNVYTLGETRIFSEDELTLLKSLAAQATQAIVNARLFYDAQQRLQQVQALRTIDTAITASLDLRLTLNVVLDQTTTQLQVDGADVLLFNPHSQTLVYAAGRGFRTGALQHTRLRLGEGHAGLAALERRLVHIPDLREAEDAFPRAPLLKDESFVSYYGVPLVAKGQVKGVLEIFHRAPLASDPDWREFLETLAGQAAIAVDSAELFDSLQRMNVELMMAYDATIEGWSRALDLRDKETEGHTQRVTEMTVRLARTIGMHEEDIVHIRRGALLHDIGKMGVPDAILLKPGKLTDAEWEVMRKHPVYAYALLSPITFLRPALDIPYCHHEKWDGTGYPRGLKGDLIPLAARLFAVADVWDALRSDRPYRAGWPEEKVRAYLREQTGTHFEPEAMEVFLKVTHSD